MNQSTYTSINWLSREQLTEIFEGHGFAVSDSESNDDLRNALRENINDGTISEDML